ncbi:unnamed protein product [Clonostachys chloroleuca]|uniref:Uncharacterized protein n=1 Tax=Clonostachys chloroleuca TaxID=1926264 RepID=A0AA35QCP8_9HYPO|nr:unnamed protein product [Clonostachys chloroleuca]
MSDDGNHSATDIITYIGVPLAVLGVLPILYNTFATLVSLSRIKRMLRRSRLPALTRSDIVNRIIEIELPRYAVMPLDRFQDRAKYWTLSNHPSPIPGGTWTTFNWRTHSIGIKNQRVEYADQVRQPQVDISFDELVCYLLDLGAVANPHGWKLLRSTGLWTPVGCCLMTSPDGKEDALTIAPSDDADGNLSLAVAWSSSWITRDYATLPPYWVRLPPPPVKEPAVEEVQAEGSQPESSAAPEYESRPGSEKGLTKGEASRGNSIELDSIQNANRVRSNKAITCQISLSGIVSALTQQEFYSNQSTVNLDSLYIDHLRITPGKSNGVWFASAATALGTSSQTVLWNYKIPDEILYFARKETVPCGVLEVIGMVGESDTPEWATKHNDYGASLDQFTRQRQQQQAAMAAEARMAPAQREAAARDRMRQENEQRMQDMRDKLRTQQQRRDQRMLEALQSPKWDGKLVAEHCFRWLKSRNSWDEKSTAKDVAGFLLHKMVLDGEFSSELCRMLDRWKAWGEVGGMKKDDYLFLQENQTMFSNATLLVALIRDTSVAAEGTVSMDLQECLRMWKKVRLG